MNSTCQDERDLVYHPAFQFMSSLALSSAFASYILMAAFFRKYAFRLYWHLNIKILFYFNMLISFFLATSIVWNFTRMFHRVLIATEDCQVVIQLKECLLIRWMFLISFCLTTLNHTAIVVERLWATIRLSKYEKSSGALGVFLAGLITSLSVVLTYLIMLSENEKEYAPTCLSLSASSVGQNVYLLFTFQCLTEILVLIVHKSLLWFNRKRKACHVKVNLTEKFQINENLAVLEQMNPLIIACALTIGGYNIVAIAIRPFRELFTKNQYIIIVFSIFVIPYLPFLLTGIAYVMLKRQLRERAEMAQKSVQLDIITNAKFSNNFYNWDSTFSARYNNASSERNVRESWWRKAFLNKIFVS